MSQKTRRRKPRKAKHIKHITNYTYIAAPTSSPQKSQRDLSVTRLLVYWKILELILSMTESEAFNTVAQCVLP